MESLILLISRGRELSLNQKIILGSASVAIILANYLTSNTILSKWPVIGICIATCIGLICLVNLMTNGRSTHSSTQLALCVLSIAVTFLQYEQNTMDLQFREAAFASYSNKIIAEYIPFFSCETVESCIFNASNIFAFNTVGLWLPLFTLPFLFHTNPLYCVFVIGSVLGNVGGLCAAAVWTLSYAPGMASGLILVVPAALWCMHRLVRHQFYNDQLIYVILMASMPWLYACIWGLLFLVDVTRLFPSATWPLFMFAASTVTPYTAGKAFGYKIEAYHERIRRERSRDPEAESLL